MAMTTPLAVLASLVLATAAQAAVSIDLDLTRLRALPGADAIRQRIEQALPEPARSRLAAIQAITGSDPRQDVQRVVITIPDAGTPSVRLIGLPAQRIAAALALKEEAVAVGGLTGHRLPNHPLAVFVAVGERDALIGRPDSLAVPGAVPPAQPQPIAVTIRPGPQPRIPAMKLAKEVRLTADGQGHVGISVTANDEAAGAELECRLGVLKAMVASGAQGGLPAMQQARDLLAAATVVRTGAALDATLVVPEALRQQAIDRLIGRIAAHAGKG